MQKPKDQNTEFDKPTAVLPRETTAFHDRIKTYMKTGGNPLGTPLLEDPNISYFIIIKIARRRGEIPRD